MPAFARAQGATAEARREGGGELSELHLQAVGQAAVRFGRNRFTPGHARCQLHAIANALADRDEIARVFERLSVEHRTIVVLYHYLGMTTDEAARTIGIPHGTAKSRLHYATEALRAALEADARGIAPGRALA